MIVGYLIGLVAGLAIVFLHPSTRSQSLLARIGLGVLCGFGLGLIVGQPLAAMLGF